MKDNQGLFTGITIGVVIGLLSFPILSPITRIGNPGFEVVDVEPSDEVFKVPMIEKGGKTRSIRLDTQELGKAKDIEAKREIIEKAWVRVRPGIKYFPGVREARPRDKVFTVSTAFIRVDQKVSAATKEGTIFSFLLSYNAQILDGQTADGKKQTQRQNAAKFIAKTVGQVPKGQTKVEVDVAQKLEQRAANIFREIMAPLAAQYNQLQIGANKGKLLEELEKQSAKRLYEEFGVTISDITYGGTQFPFATQAKIDANALAPVRKEISKTRSLTEVQRALKSKELQNAFGSNTSLGGELLILNTELDGKERWVDRMKEGVEKGTIKSPSEIIPSTVVPTKSF